MAARELRQFTTPNGEVLSVAFLPDGRRVISSGMSIIVWDIETGLPLSTLSDQTTPVMAVSSSPDGNYAISGSWDETIRLWDLNSYREILRIRAHKFGVSNVIFSPDGRFALSGSDHLSRFAYKSSHPNLWYGAILGTSLLPYNETPEETMKLWDLSSGRQLKKWVIAGCCHSLAWSSDGRFVACGEPKHVRIWEAQNWKEVRRFTGAIKASGLTQADIRSLAFSPDGQYLVTAGKDTKLHLWETTGGNLVREFVGHDGGVNSVAFSPDGRYILSGGEDNTLILWHAETGTLIARCFGHSKRVNCVAFSKDMQYGLSGSDDNTMRLWQLPGLPSAPSYSFEKSPSTRTLEPQDSNTFYQKPMPPSNANYQCPKCGEKLVYVSEYQRWYCFGCKTYV